MTSIYRVSYMSQMRIVPDADVIQAIREASVRNNLRSQVTGLLIVDRSHFIQVLEGGEQAVNATMQRIQADPRHNRISILTAGPVAKRQFGTWSMDIRRISDDEHEDAYLEATKSAMEGVDDIELRAMFIGFARMAAMRSSHPAPSQPGDMGAPSPSHA